MSMRRIGGFHVRSLALLGLSITPAFTAANGFSGTSMTGPKEVRKAIVASPGAKKSGFLAWLESWLPDGIRLAGPLAELKNSERVLATADCFDSGAGVSCHGFRSLEEYLAAVQVSENLGIPLHRLKDRMQRGRTLSQAVEDLRPGVNGQMAVLRAQQQAKAILRDFSS
jgi:hypothetical protein